MSIVAPPPRPASEVAPPVHTKSRFKWRQLLPVVLLCVGATLGAVAAVLFIPPTQPAPNSTTKPDESKKDESGTLNFAREKWENAGIRTEIAASAPLTDHVWRTGRVVVDDDRVSHLFPPVEGLIVDVRVRLGQDVEAGSVLAVLESREIGQAKLDLVTAKLAAASERERAGWATATASNTADLVKAVIAGKPTAEIDTEFKERPVGERRHTLMAAYAQRNHLRVLLANQRASTGTVSGATLQRTEADFEAAEASLRALCEEFKFQAAQQGRQAELKLKEASNAADAARTRLLTLGYTPAQIDTMDPVAEGAAASRFEVKAPFAGTVIEKHAIRSERVTPQHQMFQIADLSVVWIQADAFEPDMPLLRGLAGRGLMFRAPAAGVEERSAELVYAGDLVDRASRALTVTASAKNPGRVLKPGMFVEVGIPRGGNEPLLQVAASAVQRYQGKTFVFVHVRDDEFRRADVELGREGRDRVEVKSGVAPGDAIVVEGGFVLKSELFRDQLAGD